MPIHSQEVDETWIAKFRAWSEKLPVANSKDGRQRALSTVENSVIQLAAAFRYVKEEPRFKPLQPKNLNRTPRFETFGRDVPLLPEPGGAYRPKRTRAGPSHS